MGTPMLKLLNARSARFSERSDGSFICSNDARLPGAGPLPPTFGRIGIRLKRMPDKGWKRAFDDPTPLAGNYITKLSKAELHAPGHDAALCISFGRAYNYPTHETIGRTGLPARDQPINSGLAFLRRVHNHRKYLPIVFSGRLGFQF
jgi:hypothetical protein